MFTQKRARRETRARAPLTASPRAIHAIPHARQRAFHEHRGDAAARFAAVACAKRPPACSSARADTEWASCAPSCAASSPSCSARLWLPVAGTPRARRFSARLLGGRTASAHAGHGHCGRLQSARYSHDDDASSSTTAARRCCGSFEERARWSRIWGHVLASRALSACPIFATRCGRAGRAARVPGWRACPRIAPLGAVRCVAGATGFLRLPRPRRCQHCVEHPSAPRLLVHHSCPWACRLCEDVTPIY